MKKRYLRVLKEINEKIPQELLLALVKKEKQFTTLKTVVEEALKKPDSEVPPREKRKLQSLLDSGYLEREVDVIDKTVEQQIDAIITAEVAKAVKHGRLPKVAPNDLNLVNNKGKKYARKQAARLRALVPGSDPDSAPDVAHEAKDEGEYRARTPDAGIHEVAGKPGAG